MVVESEDVIWRLVSYRVQLILGDRTDIECRIYQVIYFEVIVENHRHIQYFLFAFRITVEVSGRHSSLVSLSLNNFSLYEFIGLYELFYDRLNRSYECVLW